MAITVGDPVPLASSLSLAGPAQPRRSGDDLIPYTPSAEVLASTGLTPEKYDLLRHYTARIEAPKYDQPPTATGSKTTPYVMGHYEMSDEEIAQAADHLGIPKPSREEFIKQPGLQERLFDSHTFLNSEKLMKYKEYAEATPEQRAAILAGGHFHGVQGVIDFLRGGDDTKDKLGTSTSRYMYGAAQTMKNGVVTIPSWTATPRAIASEQERSNTDVVNMSPEEYLSLLPPIPDDEPSRAKRANLRKSLLSGDDIEAIPSLEVQPSRGNLRIVDHDGRNRAQAAIDAGVDTIPVAIRGAPESGSFKNLIGEKTVPFQFPKAERLAEQPPLPAPAPVGATPQPTPAAPAGTVPLPPPVTAPPPGVPPSKPDFYPQIAAGLNKAQLQPASEPYRGLIPPNPANTATAADRIAAANATSAGQVGLGPNAPQNSVLSLLSALNPIGSAQAAEPTAAPPAGGGITVGAPVPMSGGGVSVGEGAPMAPGTAREPYGFMPTPRQQIAPSVVNALSPLFTSLPADVAAIMNAQPRWAGGLLPTMEAYQKAARANKEQTMLPETETGRALSSVIGIPGRMFGWAAEKVLGAGAMPYLGIVGDIAAPLSMAFPGVANALTAPLAPVMRRAAQTPVMRGVADINRAQPKELRAGGAASPEVANAIAEAQASGQPIAPINFAVPGGAQEKLFQHSVEGSPEASAAARQQLLERTEGYRPDSAQEPIGGTMERLTTKIEASLGTGSAQQISENLTNNQALTQEKLVEATKKRDAAKADTEARAKVVREAILPYTDKTKINADPEVARLRALRDRQRRSPAERDATKAELEKRIAQIRAENARDSQIASKAVRNDPELTRLKALRGRLNQERQQHMDSIKRDTAALEGLQLGRDIFSPTVTAEKISDFRQTAAPTIIDYLKIGASDTIRDAIRGVESPGAQVGKLDSPERIRNKLVAIVGNKADATALMDSITREGTITGTAASELGQMRGGAAAAARSGAQARRALEAFLHVAPAALPGAHSLGWLYWTLRGGRNIADYLASGGRVRPSSIRESIVNAMLDPYAVISADPRKLLEMPTLPAARQARIDTIRRGLPAAAYLSTQEGRQPQ